MRTHTTDLFLVEDLEDIGRTGELAENRVNDELTEQLVKGHADFFYGYEFAIQGGGEKLPDEVLRYFTSSRTPTSCAAASGSVARGTRPRRTSSARAGRSRCRSWRSGERRAGGPRGRTR